MGNEISMRADILSQAAQARHDLFISAGLMGLAILCAIIAIAILVTQEGG